MMFTDKEEEVIRRIVEAVLEQFKDGVRAKRLNRHEECLAAIGRRLDETPRPVEPEIETRVRLLEALVADLVQVIDASPEIQAHLRKQEGCKHNWLPCSLGRWCPKCYKREPHYVHGTDPVEGTDEAEEEEEDPLP